MKNQTINVVGGGLAGCECAWQLAERGFKVNLYEMKPAKFSPAHKNKNLCEIVCSNSFGGTELSTGAGLLKAEMEQLNSLIVATAKKHIVPAGGAMAVDRETFSKEINDIIHSHKNITIINEEYSSINTNELTVIATGPLTSEVLSENLKQLLGEDFLYFYDAAAPIVTSESIDKEKSFVADRYNKGNADYINCPMNKEEYDNFVQNLVTAEAVELKSFENIKVFEGCMPVEQMAKRSPDALKFGPLKPVGLTHPETGERFYAVVQLRKENVKADLYNIVGFQTNLTFKEQKRVFGLIPALKNAEFVKFGVMHRNTYINAPKVLNKNLSLKNYPNVYIAGQLSGVEGYMESCISGLIVALNIVNKLQNKNEIELPTYTMLGALISYITNTANSKNFQPMNANFGILDPLEEKIRDKKLKKIKQAEKSLNFYRENNYLWNF